MEVRKGRQTPTQSVVLPYTVTEGQEANVVYYAQDIGVNDSWTEYHEMWHTKQAEDYRKAGWTITAEKEQLSC